MNVNNKEVREWLFFASEDLAYGKLGMADLPRASAWSFQQSSEKTLKALWLETYQEIPRTYDIAYLLSELSKTFEVPEDVRDAILVLAEITPAVRSQVTTRRLSIGRTPCVTLKQRTKCIIGPFKNSQIDNCKNRAQRAGVVPKQFNPSESS